MRDLFSRRSRDDADQPAADYLEVQADDALIESLRGLRPGVTALAATAPAAISESTTFDYGDSGDADHAGEVAGFWADASRRSEPADRLAELLRAWRTEIDSAPLPPPIDVEKAVTVVHALPPRRRAIRPMLGVAAAIVGLLIGSAAIGSRSAKPNTLLFAVTELLWSDRADSANAEKGVREAIDYASNALAAGHPDAAVIAIDQVTVLITKVDERDGRASLEADLQQVKSDLSMATGGTDPTATGTTTTDTTTTDTTKTSTSPSTSISRTSTVQPPPVLTTPPVIPPLFSSSTTTPPSVDVRSTTPEPSDGTDPSTVDGTTQEPSDGTTSTETTVGSATQTTGDQSPGGTSTTDATTGGDGLGALGATTPTTAATTEQAGEHAAAETDPTQDDRQTTPAQAAIHPTA